jgi:acetyl esterase
MKVVSVAYRRAPEAAYPAGLDDCYGVVRWVGETLDLDAPLVVAGDSSGGTFVAAVTAMARDDGWNRITHQVLYYPSLDLDFDEDRYPSLRDNAVGYGLETAGLKPFNAFYLESGADPADPLVSPIKRQDLSGLPPALVVTAELDPLRDEGELYAKRLRAAGVDATTSRYDGAGHGFVQHFSWLPDYQKVYAETAEFIHARAGR